MYISEEIYYLIKTVSLYGSLVRLLLYSRVNEQNVVRLSRCDVILLQSEDAALKNASQPFPLVFASFLFFVVSRSDSDAPRDAALLPRARWGLGKHKRDSSLHHHRKGDGRRCSFYKNTFMWFFKCISDTSIATKTLSRAFIFDCSTKRVNIMELFNTSKYNKLPASARSSS